MEFFEKEYRRFLESDVLTAEERTELLLIENDAEAKALRFCAPMDLARRGFAPRCIWGSDA